MPQDMPNMTGDSPIAQKVAGARSVLASANKKFPSPAKAPAMPAKASATSMTKSAPLVNAPTLGQELDDKSKNVNAYMQANPKFHKGGVVPGEPGEEVPIIAQAGETITPAADAKADGRQSEYRKVYIARQQKRSGGGNKPVTETPEKHDKPKAAAKGIKEQKA